MFFWLLYLNTLRERGAMSVGWGSIEVPQFSPPGQLPGLWQVQLPGELRMGLWSAGSGFFIQSPWTSAELSVEKQQPPTPTACTVPTQCSSQRRQGETEGVLDGRRLAIMAVSRSDFGGQVLKTPS